MWYSIVKTLLKNNLGYDFISKITPFEASRFYADLVNDLMFDRYLQNIPTKQVGKETKVISYNNDIFKL